MYRIGRGGEMAARALAVVRDDPQFAEVLIEERKTGLIFFRLVRPAASAEWEAYYALWARIVPAVLAESTYSLEHMPYTNKWQPLGYIASLEECVREIKRDSRRVFFG